MATTSLAYVRLHGRNRSNWFRKRISTVERYQYLYTRGELDPWISNVLGVAKEVDQVFVIFNSCYRDYGIRNAVQFSAPYESPRCDSIKQNGSRASKMSRPWL